MRFDDLGSGVMGIFRQDIIDHGLLGKTGAKDFK